MPITYQIFTSPIGEILVAGSDIAITRVLRGRDKDQLSTDFKTQHEDASPVVGTGCINKACAAIADFLAGKSTRIDVAIQVDGTDFQRKIWHQLRQIPYGRTMSYSDIALAIGAPDAFRAVANACGDNPVPLIIPCHRAVHKSGNSIGFGWGVDAKRFLLGLERHHAALMEEQSA